MGVAVEAVQRLRAPEPVEGWTVIVIAAIGVLVNGLTAMLFVAGRKTDLNVRGAFLHMADDALVSLGWSSRACSTCSWAGAGSTRW